ncbi:hypothetical protein NST48_01520 [Paenibacillus sp. FSL M7-0547]|uniref:hypothetical protein n=1 Tax=Paenibacillus sp. FSL M7-0547 TaxID=2954755 RepID=UPI0030F96242
MVEFGKVIRIGAFRVEIIGYFEGKLIFYSIENEKIYPVGYTGEVSVPLQIEEDGQLAMF